MQLHSWYAVVVGALHDGIACGYVDYGFEYKLSGNERELESKIKLRSRQVRNTSPSNTGQFCIFRDGWLATLSWSQWRRRVQRSDQADDCDEAPTHLERVLLHRGHDVLEQDLGGQCVAMVHDWLHVGAVPAVDL